MNLTPTGKLGKAGMPPGFEPEVPLEFQSLDEARDSLHFQMNGFIKFFHRAEDKKTWDEAELEESREYWSGQVARWGQAFEAFLQKNGVNLKLKAQQAAWALKIQACVGAMQLKPRTSSILADEMPWDLHLQEIEEIIKSGEAIVALDEVTRGTDPDRKIEFSLDMWMVAPVYAVSHKCRDPMLRRRAISVLKRAKRQEGLWDSTIASKVAERIVAIEEGAVGRVTCCEDIPRWARINGVNVEFDKQDRRGHFSYRRYQSEEQQMVETFREVIDW